MVPGRTPSTDCPPTHIHTRACAHLSVSSGCRCTDRRPTAAGGMGRERSDPSHLPASLVLRSQGQVWVCGEALAPSAEDRAARRPHGTQLEPAQQTVGWGQGQGLPSMQCRRRENQKLGPFCPESCQDRGSGYAATTLTAAGAYRRIISDAQNNRLRAQETQPGPSECPRL